MAKNDSSLKNSGMVPTIQQDPDFSKTYSFREVVGKVELITYMKSQKILITECRDMSKKHKKYPKNWGFPRLGPQDFSF